MTSHSALAIGIGIITALSSCTGKPTPEVRTGKALTFDPARIERLEINRAEGGESPWNASFVREGEEWRIESAPGGLKVLDKRAHSGFIRHFLATLTTLQVTAPAPKGDLKSFGLDRPWASVRLVQGTEEWEIRIAPPRDVESAQFAVLPRLADAPIVEVRGSALHMLRTAKTFEDLRHRQFSTWTADDIETLRIERAGRPTFYAERAGSDWEDRKRKRIRKDMDRFIGDLSHARVRAFVDDELLAERLAQSVPSSPIQVVMKNLHGQELRLTLLEDQGRVYGLSNERQGAAFELFPETRRLLERGP